MLEKTRRRAERAGVDGRIRPVLATAKALGLDAKADFALAFWMVHEVDDPGPLFAEILAALKPDGILLLVEPLVHVDKQRFDEILTAAIGAGFESHETEAIRLSRAVVLKPAGLSRSREEAGTGS
jgi:SAM-dependent methyltransferase